mgnify:CR=1 FL=1
MPERSGQSDCAVARASKLKHSRIRRPLVWAILSITLLAFGPGLIALAHLSWKRAMMERRLRELHATHQQLSDEQRRLHSDPTYVEDLIRSTFHVAKPDELVVPLETNRPSENR